MNSLIPSINVTDLYIDHLHLGEITLDKINLDKINLNSLSFGSITKLGSIYYAYILLWLLFIFSLLQSFVLCIISCYLYKKNKAKLLLNKFNSVFIEDDSS